MHAKVKRMKGEGCNDIPCSCCCCRRRRLYVAVVVVVVGKLLLSSSLVHVDAMDESNSSSSQGPDRTFGPVLFCPMLRNINTIS